MINFIKIILESKASRQDKIRAILALFIMRIKGSKEVSWTARNIAEAFRWSQTSQGNDFWQQFHTFGEVK